MEAIETVLIAIMALEMLDISHALIFWPMKPIMRAPAAGIAFRLAATAAMVLGMSARAAEPAALPKPPCPSRSSEPRRKIARSSWK
jgi:hypothetical protein